jgi:LuxR family maltose regulon positive regulatory protein
MTDVFEMPAHVRVVVPEVSKLYAPKVRPGHLRRTALIDRLRSTDSDAMLVSAPAGYGKSTMLAELAASDVRSYAWLTLDEADNDPTVLLAGIALALDAIEPIDWDRFGELLGGPISVASPALRGFGWMLAERTIPFLLIVDDVHALVSHEALDVLEALVASLPDGSAIALSGRDGSRLHRGRLRRRRHVADVRVDDLAFDADDIVALCSVHSVELEQREIDELMERTEGWPLAVYLSLQSGHERAARHRPTAIGGNAREMAEFFSDELLASLEPATAEFLMAVATLEQFSGPMCDAVLERTGSAALLEDLERQNLLVISLDDRRERYRLHHLWAEFLSTEFERRNPGGTERLATRTGQWCEAHGDTNGAIMSAAKADDLDGVERLILADFPDYLTTYRFATIDRWLRLFGRADLMARPQLMVAAGFSKWSSGDAAAAAEWLALASAAVPIRHPEAKPGWTPAVAVAILRSATSPYSATDMAQDAGYAYEHLRAGTNWRPAAGVLRGAAAFMLGDDATAERLFQEGAFGAAERPLVRAIALAHLGVVHIERNDWDAAADVVTDLHASIRDHEWVPTTSLGTAMCSLVDARRGDTERAVEGRRLSRRQLAGFDGIAPWLNLQARIALARSALITGHRAEAATLLDEADALMVAVPDAVTVRDQLATLRRGLSTRQSSGSHGPSSLTTAELRVLQYLPTHLSLTEIAERLFVSRNTVKSHSIAIYRKLGATSRGGAVDSAREAQLLD